MSNQGQYPPVCQRLHGNATSSNVSVEDVRTWLFPICSMLLVCGVVREGGAGVAVDGDVLTCVQAGGRVSGADRSSQDAVDVVRGVMAAWEAPALFAEANVGCPSIGLRAEQFAFGNPLRPTSRSRRNCYLSVTSNSCL